MELLFLLVERRGELVTREEVADRLWGTTVFVDIDQSINTAVRKVRMVLGDDPDKPRFIETVVGKGYRFAAPVAVNGGGTVSAKAGLPGTSQPTQSGESAAIAAVPAQRMHRRPPVLMLLASIGAVLAILASGWVATHVRNTGSSTHRGIKSLVVLPLKNLSRDPGQEYLADGMTEEIIGRLSAIHDLRVISRTSAMQFKDSRLSVPEIAKALNVDALVEGSVIRDGDHVRVHAQLIRAATDEHFWSETYDRELPDVLALESDVAQSVASRVEVTVTGEEQSKLVAARHISPEVYESYLKGQFARDNSRAELERSIAYFEEAISKDATFAPAFVGLADAYERLGSSFVGVPTNEMRPRAIRAARKALELDPQLAEPHALLGKVLKKQFHWADAEAECKQALALNPNNSTAHIEYAEWLASHGRVDEALAWSRRARELDPLGNASVSVGWILFQGRRYDDSIRELRSFLAVHPDDAMAHLTLAFPIIANGQAQEAISDLEKTAVMMHRSPGALELLATAHARAGHRTEALRLLEELKQGQKTGYVQATSFINPNLALGNNEEALAWFERAYQRQEGILQWIKVHPFFDPVRDDPRFKDLVRRVGLN
jgi:TolB-like protein/tetratricopeptide (TPR) repeat protein/DNA-binding winged helix-turn-helix (wHTH) protein